MKNKKTVAIVGASNLPQRYSNKAQVSLLNDGHQVIPISIKEEEVGGIKAFKSLGEIDSPFEVITMYVNPSISSSMADEIMSSGAKYIIFNPGTENDSLEKQLQASGLKTIRACTLVLISTDQFDQVTSS